MASSAGVFDFMTLEKRTKVMFTVSGGTHRSKLQYWASLCITLREKTERSITITEGANVPVRNFRRISEMPLKAQFQRSK